MNHFDRTARCSAPFAKSTRTPPCSGNSTDPLCRCASVRTLPVPAVAAAAVPVTRDPPLIPSPCTALRDVLRSVFPCFPPQASQRQPVQGKQPFQPAPASVHEPRSGWCVARGGGASGFATALRSLTLLPRDLIPPRRRPRAQEPRHGRARQCTCHRGGRWCRHAAGCGHRQCGVRQQPAAPPHGGSATHPRLPCRRSYHGATAGSPWAPRAATHHGRGWWRRRWSWQWQRRRQWHRGRPRPVGVPLLPPPERPWRVWSVLRIPAGCVQRCGRLQRAPVCVGVKAEGCACYVCVCVCVCVWRSSGCSRLFVRLVRRNGWSQARYARHRLPLVRARAVVPCVAFTATVCVWVGCMPQLASRAHAPVHGLASRWAWERTPRPSVFGCRRFHFHRRCS